MAELKAHKGSLEKWKIVAALLFDNPRYRRYSRDEIEMATGFFSENKIIGEGAYGRVYRCCLDHTSGSIKVLRPDASDGKEEFLREVEVLSHLRHPHIVLLLGACPENGSLVYEYMENGSLEDQMFRRPGIRLLQVPYVGKNRNPSTKSDQRDYKKVLLAAAAYQIFLISRLQIGHSMKHTN